MSVETLAIIQSVATVLKYIAETDEVLMTEAIEEADVLVSVALTLLYVKNMLVERYNINKNDIDSLVTVIDDYIRQQLN